MTILKKHSKPPPRRTTAPPLPTLAPDLWDNVLEPYMDHPGDTLVMAQIFSLLKDTLKHGPQGCTAVSEALNAGIDLLFPLSDVHNACLRLYRLAVEGNLRPEFDPRTVIKKATVNLPRKD